MKFYSIGSLNIDYVYSVDHFVAPGETMSSEKMEIFPGGKGLNQSIALSKAGADVVHGAVLGNDGAFLAEVMEKAGVDVSKIKKIDAPSGHAIIQVNKAGQNCILLFAGTNHALDKKYVEDFLADAKEGDTVLLQNETNCLDVIFEIAHAKRLQIAFNPSPFNDVIKTLPLQYVNWWFCNEIEGEALFGSDDPETIADNFIKKYPESNLILTLGKNGSIFKNKDFQLYQPIIDAPRVDTTAAGDTFTGYFLNSVASGKDFATALKTATKASSIAISRKGASVSIPTADEVII
ncbi:MAG: ribokinase [Ruminococcaceae bacterium]|nr:ribokinase [Oscillospiraceae bacterium]